MAKFGFSDLHSFKDYVGFVKLCAPNLFPPREGVGPDEQWSVELAFEGLRLGLKISSEEKGALPTFETCGRLVQDAQIDYLEGRPREGFTKLDQMQKLLRKIPSQ
jgi:hypothetical protein